MVVVSAVDRSNGERASVGIELADAASENGARSELPTAGRPVVAVTGTEGG